VTSAAHPYGLGGGKNVGKTSWRLDVLDQATFPTFKNKFFSLDLSYLNFQTTKMESSTDLELSSKSVPVKTSSLAEVIEPLEGSPQVQADEDQPISSPPIMNIDRSSIDQYRVRGIEDFSIRAGWGKDLQERGAFSAVEVLYRHNLLWARANLFKHFVRRREFLDWANPEVFEAIQKDLNSYCTWMP